jgi:hypothetical protein
MPPLVTSLAAVVSAVSNACNSVAKSAASDAWSRETKVKRKTKHAHNICVCFIKNFGFFLNTGEFNFSLFGRQEEKAKNSR